MVVVEEEEGEKITEMSVVCTFDKIGTYQTVSIRNGLHVISWLLLSSDITEVEEEKKMLQNIKLKSCLYFHLK